jgi:ABC-type cobalamin transport system permease subunit
VRQSPRFSASLIGLRSLGFVGALWARRTLVPVPRLAPILLWRCVRGGPLPYTAGAPDQSADRIGFPIWRSGDHIPNSTYEKPSGPLLGLIVMSH